MLAARRAIRAAVTTAVEFAAAVAGREADAYTWSVLIHFGAGARPENTAQLHPENLRESRLEAPECP